MIVTCSAWNITKIKVLKEPNEISTKALIPGLYLCFLLVPPLAAFLNVSVACLAFLAAMVTSSTAILASWSHSFSSNITLVSWALGFPGCLLGFIMYLAFTANCLLVGICLVFPIFFF